HPTTTPYTLSLHDALPIYLHKQRYLHRDICPRNVMINQEGAVKVIDFGLTIPYTAKFCRPGNRTGTNNYLAPELIKRTTTDHRRSEEHTSELQSRFDLVCR